MRLVKISDEFFATYTKPEDELLHNEDENRPYFIVVKLMYKNQIFDFALPFRSNMSNYIPKDQYFSLPPNKNTKKNKIHGLHYIKMFPVLDQYFQKYHYANYPYYSLIHKIATDNQDRIIREAQSYLKTYEAGKIHQYAAKIDNIVSRINNITDIIKDIATTT